MKADALSKKGLETSIGKTGQKISLFETGLLGIIGYGMIHNLSPVNDLYAYTMLATGIGSIGAHYIWKDKFKILFDNCGLHKDDVYPQKKEKIKTDYGYCLRFSLPLGMSTDDFEKHKSAISQFLDRRIEIKYAHKNVLIEVYEKELDTNYPFERIDTKGILEFPVGYTYGGKIITVDLSNGEPHMLIAGESGSGKSTTIRSIITNLILTKKIKLHLIDLKHGAEFNIFKKSKNVISFSRNRAEAEATLLKLSSEVDRRYNLFYENNVVDIKEFNKIGRMDYQVVIIDEFADLQNEKGSIEIIEELAAKSRACGIHLIIATQRPDAKILNGRIKANIPIILGLKTMNELNSRIIIDEQGLENLKGKGHGLLKHGKITEIQSMNLSPTDAMDLVKHTFIEKKETPTKKPQGEVTDFDFLRK